MQRNRGKHIQAEIKCEDTSSLPVPETKFKGSERERLGQLVVTPEGSS